MSLQELLILEKNPMLSTFTYKTITYMNVSFYYLQLLNIHMNTNTHSGTHTSQRTKGNTVFKYQGYVNYFNLKSLVSSLISHTKNCLLYYQLNGLTELTVHFS